MFHNNYHYVLYVIITKQITVIHITITVIASASPMWRLRMWCLIVTHVKHISKLVFINIWLSNLVITSIIIKHHILKHHILELTTHAQSVCNAAIT